MNALFLFFGSKYLLHPSESIKISNTVHLKHFVSEFSEYIYQALKTLWFVHIKCTTVLLGVLITEKDGHRILDEPNYFYFRYLFGMI